MGWTVEMAAFESLSSGHPTVAPDGPEATERLLGIPTLWRPFCFMGRSYLSHRAEP